MEEGNTSLNLDPGHVDQIRRQWALHEDEALAHKLQNEEITQHYSGNRFRNSTVREDLPRAREEQEREEREALEDRLRQLKILQEQERHDARVARLISIEHDVPLGATALVQDDLDFDVLDNEDGIGPLGQTEAEFDENNPAELKRIQEERDAVFARRLQEELEQDERDKLIAIEAQDRELAKMIYLKEKAKIKRAKERAKLKAEATAARGTGTGDYSEPNDSISSKNSVQSSSSSSFEQSPSPPKIPEKSKSSESDDPIGFRAVPKSLPPNPQTPTANLMSPFSRDPIPPYMPMQGLKNQAHSKRK